MIVLLSINGNNLSIDNLTLANDYLYFWSANDYVNSTHSRLSNTDLQLIALPLANEHNLTAGLLMIKLLAPN
ncbi:MAG: hypothetical protein PHW00_01310 [Clostridia bacterium]|nr:hypothetical protein [Clostridia bacterium]